MTDDGVAGKHLTRNELIADMALSGSQDDDLNHNAVARVVTDLIRNVSPPANIALFGPWGSGKSSIYSMVENNINIESNGIKVVRYDAWKFGGQQLQRNFLSHVVDSLNIGRDKYLSNLTSGVETTRLRLGKFLKINFSSVAGALLTALVIAGLWYVMSAEVAFKLREQTTRGDEYIRAVPSAFIAAGTIIGAMLLSSQALAAATEKRNLLPMQDADHFAAAFTDLLSLITRKRFVGPQINRLVVLIDELDRCAPIDVVATLTHLKTFLNNKSCVFVVAADREVIESALETTPEAKPIRENEPYYSTAGAFLDKIFQHQISIPPVRAEALTNYAMALVNGKAGLWSALRGDQRTYEDVVYSLVPAHVQSPRRVKVLLNNYVTNVRVIQARGLAWKDRATEIAVLTVLQTEFPAVAKDLIHQPRLLNAIVGGLEVMSDELRTLSVSYGAYEDDSESVSKTAAPLYLGSNENDERTGGVRARLNIHLDAYLGKIYAAGIKFPAPDLVYLQQAAHVEGLSDARLAQLLDFATDTDPAHVADSFSSASSKDKQAAIRVLIARANSNVFGPSRANLIEAACRIAEKFEDLAEVEVVASQVAGTVLAEVRKGRWRGEATPGALIIGLLDKNISHPIDALGDEASAAQLAKEGFFDRLFPLMSFLNDRRVQEIDELLGIAYLEFPDAMHSALRDLPQESASRLWESQGGGIRTVIGELGDSAPTTEGASGSTVDSAESRYNSLLADIHNRHERADSVGQGALLIGIESNSDELYEVAWNRRDILLNVVQDKNLRNRTALRALAQCPWEHLGGWREHIDITDRDIASGDVEDLVHRLLELLRTLSASDLPLLSSYFVLIADWTSSPLALDLASKVKDILSATPFGGGNDERQRRLVSFEVLEIFRDKLKDGYIESAKSDDIGGGIDRVTTSAALDELLKQIASLDKQSASALDDSVARRRYASKQIRFTRLRVRIELRKSAQRAALRFSQINKFMEDSDVSGVDLLAAWLRSKPSLAEVERAVQKGVSLRRVGIGHYASTRSIADRGKLWLSLYRQGYNAEILALVGQYGVNDNPIKELAAEIVGADLSRQRKLVDVLLTADIGSDPGARLAITHLALDLLRSDLAGSGPLAARIVILAGGAGRGRTRDLRLAFDSYTARHPKTLTKKLLRALDEKNLLTKKKRNPIAPILRWFT